MILCIFASCEIKRTCVRYISVNLFPHHAKLVTLTWSHLTKLSNWLQPITLLCSNCQICGHLTSKLKLAQAEALFTKANFNKLLNMGIIIMPFLQYAGFSATHAFQRKWLPVGTTVGWMTSPSQPPTPLACTSRILPPIWRLNHLYQDQLGTCLTDPCYWGQHRHHAFWLAKCHSHLSVIYWWCMFWSRLGYMYILVACSSPAQNLQHLQALFQCLSDHRLVINPTKCDFGQSKLNFLSYTINTSGIGLYLKRVEAVCTFVTVPQDMKALYQFVGLIITLYYHWFTLVCWGPTASATGPGSWQFHLLSTSFYHRINILCLEQWCCVPSPQCTYLHHHGGIQPCSWSCAWTVHWAAMETYISKNLSPVDLTVPLIVNYWLLTLLSVISCTSLRAKSSCTFGR